MKRSGMFLAPDYREDPCTGSCEVSGTNLSTDNGMKPNGVVQIYWEMDRRPLRWTMGPTYGWDKWYEFEGQYLYQGALGNFDPWDDPEVE